MKKRKDCSECFHYDVCGASLMLNADECDDFLCKITCGMCAHHNESGFCDLIRDTTDNDGFCHRAKRRKEIMPRYIDAEKLEQRLRDFSDWCRDNRKEGVDFVLNGVLADTLIEDVQEVRHGKWLPYRFGLGVVKCSICGTVYEGGDSFRFCPKCGAKMDLRGEIDKEK